MFFSLHIRSYTTSAAVRIMKMQQLGQHFGLGVFLFKKKSDFLWFLGVCTYECEHPGEYEDA